MGEKKRIDWTEMMNWKFEKKKQKLRPAKVWDKNQPDQTVRIYNWKAKCEFIWPVYDFTWKPEICAKTNKKKIKENNFALETQKKRKEEN